VSGCDLCQIFCTKPHFQCIVYRERNQRTDSEDVLEIFEARFAEFTLVMRWGLITRILPARFFIHPDHHLFFLKPSTRKMSSANLESFTQNITLPLIKELLDPDFLNVLLPPPAAPVKPDVSMQDSPNTTPVLAASNPMMDVLVGTAHQTLTANRAPAYRSTLNATLDAFQAMNAHAYGTDNIDHNLKKSWEEDPELTLRIIWNLRSIHDGKSEKEAFYR
jgi:hypothetical protein